MSIYFQMKKVLFFVAYLCLFFLTSVTLWAIHVAAGSGSYSKGITYDWWNKAVEEIETEWYDLHYPAPYWGAPFYHNDSRLSDQTFGAVTQGRRTIYRHLAGKQKQLLFY